MCRFSQLTDTFGTPAETVCVAHVSALIATQKLEASLEYGRIHLEKESAK